MLADVDCAKTGSINLEKTKSRHAMAPPNGRWVGETSGNRLDLGEGRTRCILTWRVQGAG